MKFQGHKIKIGSKLWSRTLGFGEVTFIDEKMLYAILVQFQRRYGGVVYPGECGVSYPSDGRLSSFYTYADLFFPMKIKIEPGEPNDTSRSAD